MLAACDPTRPSNTTSTTTSTTSVPATTTVASTTIPTTTTVAVSTFTVSGTITAELSGQPIANAEMEILDGVNAGRKFLTDGSGVYSAPSLPPGTFNARFRAVSFDSTDRVVTITNANVRLDIVLRPVGPVAVIVPPQQNPGYNCGTDLSCPFNGSQSTGTGLNQYNWTFGDGGSASGAMVNHTYAASFIAVPFTQRQATVTLTVRDTFGRTNTASIVISVYRRY
jgi:hypothetical protein